MMQMSGKIATSYSAEPIIERSILDAPQTASDEPSEDRGRARHTFTFWKGRGALYAVLKALEIGPGDSVVLPGYTCFAVPAAIQLTGARPLYVDIEGANFNISWATLGAALDAGNEPGRVKAIIVQHTYGLAAEVSRIAPWARDRGIALIEDCAHVWGSRYRDADGTWRDLGTAGDAAFFSSHWTKPVSTGLGGWATTANITLADRLRRFHREQCLPPSLGEVSLLAAQVAGRELLGSPRLYWMARSLYRRLYGAGILVGSSTAEELKGMAPKVEDYTRRMSGFQEWLLERRRSNAALLARRRELGRVYAAALAGAGFPALAIPEWCEPVLHGYPVRVPDKRLALEAAERRGIALGDWYRYPVDRPDGVAAETFGYRDGMCPEGERAAAETVTLPMGARVTDRDALNAVRFLREVA